MSIAAIFGSAKGAAMYWREILIGALALGLLWYRGEALSCEALALADRAAQAAAIVEFQQADAARTRALEDAHHAEVERIRSEADDRVAAIRRAPTSSVCLSTPAARAFIDGLRKPPDAGAPTSAR